ncbi:MAG: 3'-5' exonuclease, partial [Bacteroidota bacterium]
MSIVYCLLSIVSSLFSLVNSPLNLSSRFAIVDIETTGSWNASTGITEIAILIHDTKQVVDSYQTLINPGSPVLPFVTRLTGITNEMLLDAPTFPEVAKKIWEMTDNCIFVAHAVNFDYSYIHRAFKELGADFRRKKLCTVRLSRKIFPGYNSYSLGNICSSLGIQFQDRHRAMGDAQATVKLFEHCIAND